ncbi:DUF1566 domain-containing protein [Pseudomarimonas arenosa]|uniref:DUF1566 domain-containing protein n=1 Tax=Pseudomarimonas arenosa TaxID=2774145 RepID=A0AAW3ZDF1_9GAMM|nr:DUF1566 domain-containing protein [Pseudomarimonas arenosa]MBD8524340.1 DUF1566 domain-containing protein [Pseudomarimonas arenosa]
MPWTCSTPRHAVPVLALLAVLFAPADAVATDSGQTRCFDASGSTGVVSPATPDPEAAGFNRQDCSLGASAAAALGVQYPSDIGSRGKDFSKLGSDGSVLPASASSWSCVRDNQTGLIWEVKTSDGGLRDRNHSYTWYSDDANSNGGLSGSLGSDTCAGTLTAGQCNTQAFIDAVNALTGNDRLCAATDWRLPRIDELQSIVDLSVNPRPAIDTALFPNTVPAIYWSASNAAGTPTGAWGLMFDGGVASFYSKGSSGAYVRLVRSTP